MRKTCLDLAENLKMRENPLEKLELTGYYPGAIGQITECHAVYYYDNCGFDISFEAQVGSELSEFMTAYQENRDGLWIGKIDERFVGSVVIDGSLSSDEGARLRWFIVTPEYQGFDIGKRLLDEAVRFCKTIGHKRVFLWTCQGLDVARALYERQGFRLAKEHKVDQWGQVINEQMFVLDL